MTATAVFPLAVWQEGSTQNAIPANENTVHIQAAFGPAKDFSDASPSSPADYDQYVIRTAWGGFTVGNIIIFVNGAFREFATFNGLSKLINGVRYVMVAGTWRALLTWVDVPATASSPGTPGMMARDASNLFFYVCVATNTWERCALASDVTPPPPPPAYPVPALLLDYEDATVIDHSPNVITVNQHSCATTTAQKKWGSQGLAINGSVLTISDSRLVVGTQDFTMDMWVYPTYVGSERFFIDSRDSGGTGRGFGWIFHGGGWIGIYDGGQYVGAESSGQSGIAMTANAWHHVEIGRASGTVYLFLDGVIVAQSAANQFPNDFQSPNYTIHAGQFYPVGVESMEGYADEVRIVIGQCVHTAAFVPPTSQYPTY